VVPFDAFGELSFGSENHGKQKEKVQVLLLCGAFWGLNAEEYQYLLESSGTFQRREIKKLSFSDVAICTLTLGKYRIDEGRDE
jgi:hypothetical protein